MSLENAGTPYCAIVTINDMQYGVGYGTSKKQAKSEAAKATLEILIPEMREKIQANDKAGVKTESTGSDSYLSVSYLFLIANYAVTCMFFVITYHKNVLHFYRYSMKLK